ncbi:aromatic prenyltransferase [Auricularia subglabra TFB-10046 SS5]|nr:aromatic prenyltransferase [Auricularia subglabra TFB-10046 SS5]
MTFSANDSWYGSVIRPIRSLMEAGGYPTDVIRRVEAFLYNHILEHLGPSPRGSSPETLHSSFMCDDGSSIEFSVVVENSGETTVRCAIEPIETVAGVGVPMRDPRTLIEAMKTDSTIHYADTEWFTICKDTLTKDFDSAHWHALASQHKLQHKSQYFFGYDFGRDGRILIKAYFIPHLLSAATGKPTEMLIGETCDKLGLSTPWNALIDFAAARPVAPEFAITAIDLLPAEKNRLKVYVRAPRSEMSFLHLRSYFTLDGRLKSPAIDDALEQLWDLWIRLFPCDKPDMSREEQEARLIPALHNGDANTAALCMYYDLRQGASLPAPKVYIPVRHFCESDRAISRAFSEFYLAMGNVNGFKRFGEDATAAFAHLPVSSPIGRHTYISCAIKRGDHEFSAYYSSMAFSQLSAEADA